MDNGGFAEGYAMGNNCNNNGAFGMEWLFALLVLPMMWGNGGFWGNNRNGEPMTESSFCNGMNFNNLENAVGRGFDQQTQFAFQNQRDMCEVAATLSSQIAAAAAAQERCCCETKSDILENRYLAAQNTAAINANTTAQVQKVLDGLCGLRMEMKDDRNAQLMQRVNQLEMQQLMCGVVRYPTQTTYATNCNPFFGYGYGNGYDCNRYGNGNI